MEVLYWVLPLLLLWPLIRLIQVMMVTKVILGLRFEGTVFETLEATAVPASQQEAMRPGIARLTELGFRLEAILRRRSGLDEAFDEIIPVLAHPQARVRAAVMTHQTAERSGCCWVAFVTPLDERSDLVTSTHAEVTVPDLFEHDRLETMPDGDLAVVFNRHRERVQAAEAAGEVRVDWRSEYPHSRAQRRADAQIEELLARRALAMDDEGRITYRLGPAVVAAVRAVRRMTQAKRAAKGRPPPMPAPIGAEAQSEFDWRHYRQMRVLQTGRMSQRAKTAFTLVTFALFAATLAWWMSPAAACALIAALVFHEAGHIAGMRLFGHQDTQMLFLPFFGGVAMAHDDRVLEPWKELVILFLGPLPGLVLGLAGVFLVPQANEWVREFCEIAIWLNAFNLLPVLPLDGGRIVDTAFATRFPRARIGFLGVSGVLLALLGLVPGMIMLTVLGVGMLIRLPFELKCAGLLRDLRALLPAGADEETTVRNVLHRMREADWAKVPVVQRIAQARALQLVLRRPLPGVGTFALALLGFVSPLAAGLPLILFMAEQQGRELVRAAEARAVAAGLHVQAVQRQTAAPAAGRNAAPAVEEACARLRSLGWRQLFALDEEGSGDAAGAPDLAPVVAALRQAAQADVFVPSGAAAPAGAARLVRPSVIPLLIRESKAAAAAGRRADAVAIAAEATRLVALMETAPHWWSFAADASARSLLWSWWEELLADEAPVGTETLRLLQWFGDIGRYLQYARIALPLERQALARIDGEWLEAAVDGEPEADRARRAWRVLAWLQRLDPDYYRSQAREIDDSIELARRIDDAIAGRWPKPPPELADEATAEQWTAYQREAALHLNLSTLADEIAVLQQLQAALAIRREIAAGRRPARWPDLAAAGLTAAPVHPASQRPLLWETRGGRAVLVYEVPPEDSDAEERPAFSWRLPAGAAEPAR